MSNKKKRRPGRPSKFPPEFRRDAVAMALDEQNPRPIAEVARSLGVNAGTLGNWVAQERVERGDRDGLTVPPHPEGRIIGFGFRRFAHYRTRVLLYCGAPNWDLPATVTPR